ncbi:MAG: hypothetical protein LUC45_02120 [Paraprevotella sp.]|nr:hypothetical protein [Paraprevotella sp.]
MKTDAEAKLRANVLDDVSRSKRSKNLALAGLVIGLWGPFVAATLILFLLTRGVQVL